MVMGAGCGGGSSTPQDAAIIDAATIDAMVGPACGNEVIEDGEDCDGAELAGETCRSQADMNGELTCTDCSFDTSSCVPCAPCSDDGRAVVDCDGAVVTTCGETESCDPTAGECRSMCDIAAAEGSSTGCEFYTVQIYKSPSSTEPCFAVAVTNTSATSADLTVEYLGGQVLNPNFNLQIVTGEGAATTYSAYDDATGLAAGQTALAVLAGNSSSACPFTPAVSGTSAIAGTTTASNSFRIRSSVPVAAHQYTDIFGAAGVPESSLLLPTAAWGTRYVLMSAYRYDVRNPTANIIASEANTTVTITPVDRILAGDGVPFTEANTPLQVTLDAGEHLQLDQSPELTGSTITADKPIGMFARNECMRVPLSVAYCGAGEEMVPPVSALGHEHVGVMHRPRAGEPAVWRMVGVVDGTQLTWSSNIPGAPTAVDAGEVVEFTTGTPFVVTSQDADHPFLLAAYMSGSQWDQLSDTSGYGDPSMVLSIPTAQYGRRAVFYTSPGFPETNIVVVRAKEQGVFHDVDLGCAGTLAGWQAVGDYEWTRVDLSTGDFDPVGTCDNGTHELTSDGAFGAWVWGWGTPLTTSFTANTSYGHPAAMGLAPLNSL